MGGAADRLRVLLGRGRPLIVPGATDSATAVVVGHEGIEALYVSTRENQLAWVGGPDLDRWPTYDAVLATATAIARAGVVIWDTDDDPRSPEGLASVAYQAASDGIAAVVVGDRSRELHRSTYPRGRHLSAEEMAAKVAAVRHHDILVVGRAGPGPGNWEASSDRAFATLAACEAAGADLLALDEPTLEDVSVIRGIVKSPLVLIYRWNVPLTEDEAAALGVVALILPTVLTRPALEGARLAAKRLVEGGDEWAGTRSGSCDGWDGL